MTHASFLAETNGREEKYFFVLNITFRSLKSASCDPEREREREREHVYVCVCVVCVVCVCAHVCVVCVCTCVCESVCVCVCVCVCFLITCREIRAVASTTQCYHYSNFVKTVKMRTSLNSIFCCFFHFFH